MPQKRSSNFDTRDLIENTSYNRHIIATYARRTANRLMKEGVDPNIPILKESQLKEMSSEELTDYRTMLGNLYRNPEETSKTAFIKSKYGAFGVREASEFDVYYLQRPKQSRRAVVQPERIRYRTGSVFKNIDDDNIPLDLLSDIISTKSPHIEKIIKENEESDWYSERTTSLSDVTYFEPEYYDTFDYDADSKIDEYEQSSADIPRGNTTGQPKTSPLDWFDEETGEITGDIPAEYYARIQIENVRTLINEFKYYSGPDKSKKHQAEYRNNAYEVENILNMAISEFGHTAVGNALSTMATSGYSLNAEYFYKDNADTDFWADLLEALNASPEAMEQNNDDNEDEDWYGYDDWD